MDVVYDDVESEARYKRSTNTDKSDDPLEKAMEILRVVLKLLDLDFLKNRKNWFYLIHVTNKLNFLSEFWCNKQHLTCMNFPIFDLCKGSQISINMLWFRTQNLKTTSVNCI